MPVLALPLSSGSYGTAPTFPTLYLEWSPTTGPTDVPVWERIALDDIRQLDVRRGRGRELDRFQAGQMSAVLDNRLRTYDPEYSAGTYYGNIKPMRQVRLRAVWDRTYDVATTFADSWDQNYQKPKDATCTLRTTDGFKILQMRRLPGSVWEAWIRNETTSPRAWYRLSEPSDATVCVDGSGNGYHGTISGNPQQVGSVPVREPDQAKKFDGVDDYAELPHSVAPTGTSWTVEGWVSTAQFSGAGVAVFLFLGDNAGTPFVNIYLHAADHATPGRVGASVNTTTMIGTSNVLGADRVHIAVTRDGSDVRLYVNGVQEDSDTLADATAMTGVGEAWLGRNHSVSPAYFPGTVDEVVIWDSALTATQILNHYDAGSSPLSGDAPGDRVDQILDWLGYADTARDIDTGESTLQSTNLGSSALEYLQRVAETEEGYLFVANDGDVRFIGRNNTINQTSQYTFGDSGSELPYSDIEFDYSDSTIFNEGRVNRDGGVMQVYQDDTSIADYAARGIDRHSQLNDTDEDSYQHAAWLVNLHADPTLRITSITVEPQTDPTTMFPAVLSLELGDWVTIRRRPQGVGSMIEQVAIIQGIEHRITPKRWTTKFFLDSARTAPFLILDDATYGTIDSTNLIAW